MLEKVAIIGATVVIAWLSTTFVEDPIRFRPTLLGRRRPLVVGAWAAGAIAIVVAVTVTASNVEAARERQQVQSVQGLIAQSPRCLGAQARDPDFAPCINEALDGVLAPDPESAERDDPGLAACTGMTSGKPNVCSLGVTTGYTKRLFAVGDSHASMLIGAFRAIANANHWQIDVASLGGCYLTTGTQMVPPGDIAPIGCEQWKAGATQVANDGDYDAIIVMHSDSYHPITASPGETVDQATVRGLVGAWNSLPDVPIIAIRDNPSMPSALLSCVEQHHRDAATACAFPRARSFPLPDGQAEAAKLVARARVVDLTSFFCGCLRLPASDRSRPGLPRRHAHNEHVRADPGPVSQPSDAGRAGRLGDIVRWSSIRRPRPRLHVLGKLGNRVQYDLRRRCSGFIASPTGGATARVMALS